MVLEIAEVLADDASTLSSVVFLADFIVSNELMAVALAHHW